MYRDQLSGHRYVESRLNRYGLPSCNYHIDDNGKTFTFCDCGKRYAIRYRMNRYPIWRSFVAKRKYTLSAKPSPSQLKLNLNATYREMCKDSWAG